jgi:hypothetical protein
MKGSGKLLSGVLLGAGVMYVLDPDRGARRRSLIRDKGVWVSRKVSEGVGSTARDVRNRSSGTAAAVASKLKRDQAGDEIVQERVRSALGRVCSHPGAIEVSVYNRRVILRGAVPAAEVDTIIRSIGRVRGVREVENQLEVHEDTSKVSSLQGSGRSPLGRTRLSPTSRLLLGALGTAAAIAGMKNKGGLSNLLSGIGLGAVAQAVLDVGIGRPARGEQHAESPGSHRERREERESSSPASMGETSMRSPG